jgi:hypothetical protein
MKNPLAKQDNTALFVSIAVGAITAGAIAYLYLTEDGAEAREKLSGKIKGLIKDAAAGVIADKTPVSKKTAKKVVDHVAK